MFNLKIQNEGAYDNFNVATVQFLTQQVQLLPANIVTLCLYTIWYDIT